MTRSDVFLNAGDFYFHRPDVERRQTVVVRTLLGSCVSIILWHPERRLGGMCHCVLPVRSQSYGPMDGNHCEGAVQLFLRELERSGTRPLQYKVYLLGGARMSLGLRNAQKVSVGERNVESCQRLLHGAGFRIAAEHVGMTGPRRIEFNLDSGSVEVQHANRRLSLSA